MAYQTLNIELSYLIKFINTQVLSETGNMQDQLLQDSQEELKESEIEQNAPKFKSHNKKCTIFRDRYNLLYKNQTP